MKDVGRDGQSKRESECKKSPRQGGRGVKLLIDGAQSTRKEQWELKAAKREVNKQRSRIKYSLRAP
jgi:hypothetical protein